MNGNALNDVCLRVIACDMLMRRAERIAEEKARALTGAGMPSSSAASAENFIGQAFEELRPALQFLKVEGMNT